MCSKTIEKREIRYRSILGSYESVQCNVEEVHMKEKLIEEIRNRKVRMAICYDFDKTLCTTDMQNYGFMKDLGMEPDDFWAACRLLH